MNPCANNKLEFSSANLEIAVFNRESKKSYLIGIKEYTVLKHMDGKRSFEALSQLSGGFSVSQIVQLTEQFQKMGFLSDRVSERRKFKMFGIKFGFLNGNKLFKCESFTVRLLEFMIMYLSIPLFVYGVSTYFRKADGLTIEKVNQLGNMPYWSHLLLFIAIAAIHELAHAVVARKHRVAVPEIGIMFYLIIPLLYTNLSFIKMLENKFQRIQCILAGIMSNFLLAGTCLLSAYFASGRLEIVFLDIALMNVLLVVMNLMIFFKLDGYFIFQEILDESYLREKSFAMIVTWIREMLKELSNLRSSDPVFIEKKRTQERNDFFYYIYGVLCLFYVPVLLLSFAMNFLQYIN